MIMCDFSSANLLTNFVTLTEITACVDTGSEGHMEICLLSCRTFSHILLVESYYKLKLTNQVYNNTELRGASIDLFISLKLLSVER